MTMEIASPTTIETNNYFYNQLIRNLNEVKKKITTIGLIDTYFKMSKKQLQ